MTNEDAAPLPNRASSTEGMRAVEDADLRRLLDAEVARLWGRRTTFTEAEALAAVWQAGYDVSPSIDPRFVLVREADGQRPRHWRLEGQALANNRLLDALVTGRWDGRELDRELDRLDRLDGVRSIFCPLDARFDVERDGALHPAKRETTVPLTAAVREELGGLRPALLERWRSAGAQPWTLRQVTEALGALGWSRAAERGAWQLVRAWLGDWAEVARVGVDYWVIAAGLPTPHGTTHLQVVPVIAASADSGEDEREEGTARSDTPGDQPTPSPPAALPELPARPDQAAGLSARWTDVLRTTNLIEGAIHVPAQARHVYPARAPGQERWQALRGKWFETDEDLWLWLDRASDRLCGPALAEQLGWLEAGRRVHIQWTPEVVVLRLLGVDETVQREEMRLVDVAELAALRAGLGESYRQSLQAILAAHPDGLTFPQLVDALCRRQGHVVHRGTIRALLSAGNFRRREGRWYAADDSRSGARRLRLALAATLLPRDSAPSGPVDAGDPAQLRLLAQGVAERLRRLRAGLRRP